MSKHIVQNSKQIAVLKRTHGDRTYGVFIRCGTDSRLLRSLAVPGRSYDVIVSLYAEPADLAEVLDVCDLACAGGLSKYHAAKLLDGQCSLTRPYQYVLFLDADVEIESRDVEALFRIASTHNLSLCQASLTPDSFTAFGFLKHALHEREHSATNFVEVMAPCFSREALIKCIASFDQSISTWGLDMKWPFLLRFKGLAVIDAIQMRHTGHPDEVRGTFYKYLTSIGIDPRRELAACRRGFIAKHIYTPGRISGSLGWLSPFASKVWTRLRSRILGA